MRASILKSYLLLLVFCNFDHLSNKPKKRCNLNCVYGRYMLLPIIFIASKCEQLHASHCKLCKTLSIKFSSTRSFIGWPTVFWINSKYAIKHLHSERFVFFSYPIFFSLYSSNKHASAWWFFGKIFNMNFFKCKSWHWIFPSIKWYHWTFLDQKKKIQLNSEWERKENGLDSIAFWVGTQFSMQDY